MMPLVKNEIVPREERACQIYKLTRACPKGSACPRRHVWTPERPSPTPSTLQTQAQAMAHITPCASVSSSRMTAAHPLSRKVPSGDVIDISDSDSDSDSGSKSTRPMVKRRRTTTSSQTTASTMDLTSDDDESETKSVESRVPTPYSAAHRHISPALVHEAPPCSQSQAYFKQFPDFPFNSSQPSMPQLFQLHKQEGWSDDRLAREKKRLSEAYIADFECFYGSNANDIETWRALYRALGIDPAPDEIWACMVDIRDVHVNICDLVENKTIGAPVHLFASEQELSRYSRATKKIFPRERVPKEGLLQYLLKRILNPR